MIENKSILMVSVSLQQIYKPALVAHMEPRSFAALRSRCPRSSSKQRKSGKPQILRFGALLITASHGFPTTLEGSLSKTCGSKRRLVVE